MKKDSVLGIIGGMGPEATADVYLNIIRILQKRFNAKYDFDFPKMFFYNLPIPDVVEEQGFVEKYLEDAVRKMEDIGCSIVSIACITADNQVQNIEKESFVSIIEALVEFIKKKGYRKVGILGTKMTIDIGSIQKRLSYYDIDFSIPNEKEQEQVTKIIMNVLSGSKKNEDKENVICMSSSMIDRGCDCILLACTDLPLLIKENKIRGVDVLNPNYILADFLVKKIKGVVNG